LAKYRRLRTFFQVLRALLPPLHACGASETQKADFRLRKVRPRTVRDESADATWMPGLSALHTPGNMEALTAKQWTESPPHLSRLHRGRARRRPRRLK